MDFERYLVETCELSEEHVRRARQLRRRSMPPLGTLAQERQLLSHAQVEKVLRHQRGGDVRFGETAVQLGLMSNHDVTSLLDLQRQRTPTVSDVLVEMGAVDEGIYEWVLEWYELHGPQAVVARRMRLSDHP